MRSLTLAALVALALTACGGTDPTAQPEVQTAPAQPVVCQIVIGGVPRPC